MEALNAAGARRPRQKPERPTRVVYVSMLMAPNTYARVFQHAAFPPSQAAQAFHGMLTSGLIQNGAEVVCLTAPPVSRATSERRFLRLPTETDAGRRFCYLPVCDVPVLKYLVTCVFAFFTALSLCDKRTYVLCDGLNVAVSAAARLAAHLRRRPAAAVVTDLPEMLGGRMARPCTRQIARYDGFVFLTDAVSARLNPRGRPVLVMEGMVDECMHARHNIPAEKHAEKVVLYAGMLHAIYGVTALTDAFSRVADPEARLVLYGAGDAVDAVKAAAAADPRIGYRGVAPRETVLREEIRATLLVNPRPSDAEYTKYSFPSKNLEYMASGTPLLTTRLPGMPADYLPHVYAFSGETAPEMADTLSAVLALPRETLHEKGLAAKAFVLAHKNNRAQSLRILQFLKELTSHA